MNLRRDRLSQRQRQSGFTSTGRADKKPSRFKRMGGQFLTESFRLVKPYKLCNGARPVPFGKASGKAELLLGVDHLNTFQVVRENPK